MSPGEDLQRKIVRALRHGEFGFRGSFERGGYLSIDSLKEAFGGGEDVWSEAFRLDRRAKKTRLDYGRPGYLRALQGHSSDCGHELPYMAAPLDASAVADLQRSHGKYIYHGTDIHVVEGIVSRGLLPGGGPGGRLANHFVVGTMPTQWSDARGFRRGSNTVAQCDLEVLGRAGVRLFQGADGVLLADTVPPEAIPFSGSSARTTSAGPTRRSLPRSARTACCTSCETFGLRPLRPRPQPWTIPRLLPAARMSQAPRFLARARVPRKQTLRSPARAVICRTRRPLRPPRPRGVVELQKRLVRSALQPVWETSCPRLRLPTRPLPLGISLTKRARSSSLWPGTWKVQPAWSEQRAWSPPVRVLSTAGSWSMQRISFAARRSSSSSRVSRRVRPLLAPRPRGVRRLTEMRASSGDIDAFMGKAEAEARDEPMADASKEERSTSEELVPDDPESLYYRAHKSASRVPRQFKAASHVALPPGIMAAMTEEAPDMPNEESDGTFVVRWHLHRAACHNVPLSKAIFPPPSAMDSYRQDFRGQWFRLSREGLFFEITEAHRARAARNLGQDVVLPLLVKGDKIRLKDGTCLRYGEGFEEESEPEADPVTTAGGGSRVPRGMEMRDDPDEQEQVRRLRERGSGSSAPVTPPKAKPRKGGRNKVSAFAEPSGTPPRPPSGPRAEARAARLESEAPEAASSGGAPAAPEAPEPRNQPIVQSQAVLSVGQLDLLLLRGRQPAGVRRLFLPTGWRPFRGRPVWKQEGDRSLVP